MTYELQEQEKIFVNLFKFQLEKDGKKISIYRPAGIKTGKTFPVGIGEYDIVGEDDYGPVKEYKHRYFITVYGKDSETVVLLLQNADDKHTTKIELERKVKKDKSGFYFGNSKPVEIAGKRYWITLTKNTNPERKYALNLVLKEAEKTSYSSPIEEVETEDIDFDNPF